MDQVTVTIEPCQNSQPGSGFHTEGWGPWNPPPLPEILKLSMVIIVASMCCLKSLSQIASEAIWEDLNSKISRGYMPPDHPSSHTRLDTVQSSSYPCFPLQTQNPVWNPAACNHADGLVTRLVMLLQNSPLLAGVSCWDLLEGKGPSNAGGGHIALGSSLLIPLLTSALMAVASNEGRFGTLGGSSTTSYRSSLLIRNLRILWRQGI